jgi:hypothetical protein
MGLYENIDTDFANRTLRIIEQYDEHIPEGPDKYEVTLLVNCLLGLLVLPQQRRYDGIPDVPLDNLNEWQIEGAFITAWGIGEHGQPAPRTLRELVRRLRNSVAHFQIEAEGTHTDIERLTFVDRNGFRATIPVDNLRGFVKKFASAIGATHGAGG